MTKWQPIETAPKDETEVLVFRMDCGCTPIVHVAFYRSEEQWDNCPPGGWASKEEYVGWWSYVRNSISQEKLDDCYTPTHWMPLPLPPKENENDPNNR
jgi:hypothetical protein